MKNAYFFEVKIDIIAVSRDLMNGGKPLTANVRYQAEITEAEYLAIQKDSTIWDDFCQAVDACRGKAKKEAESLGMDVWYIHFPRIFTGGTLGRKLGIMSG